MLFYYILSLLQVMTKPIHCLFPSNCIRPWPTMTSGFTCMRSLRWGPNTVTCQCYSKSLSAHTFSLIDTEFHFLFVLASYIGPGLLPQHGNNAPGRQASQRDDWPRASQGEAPCTDYARSSRLISYIYKVGHTLIIVQAIVLPSTLSIYHQAYFKVFLWKERTQSK